MDADIAKEIIALLEEIRDSQRLMVEQQQRGLARQEEALGLQREREAKAASQTNRADILLSKADALQTRSDKGIRTFGWVFAAVFGIILLVVFLSGSASTACLGHHLIGDKAWPCP